MWVPLGNDECIKIMVGGDAHESSMSAEMETKMAMVPNKMSIGGCRIDGN